MSQMPPAGDPGTTAPTPEPAPSRSIRLPSRAALRIGFGLLVPAVLYLGASHTPPFGIVLSGAVIGSLYALIAMGIILVYRASRVISFAQAGLGAAPAVAAILLYTDRHVPYPLALVAMVVFAAALGAAVDVVVVRRFHRAPRLILTVATIGVAELLAFLELRTPQLVSGEALPPTQFRTPLTRVHARLAGVVFTGDHLLAVVVVLATVGALTAFLRWTAVGVAVRAAAENSDRASTLGIPVRGLSTMVWVIAAALSGIGVFLRAPIVGLPLGGLIGPSLLLFALAAAAIAGMESLPVAFGAGVVLGVVDQLVFYVTGNGTLSIAVLLPLVLVALLLQPSTMSRAADLGASSWRSVVEPRRLPEAAGRTREVIWLRRATRAGGLSLLLLLPFLVGRVHRDLASLFAIYAIVAISLVVLTGWAGQISLGQLAFAGVGGAVAGKLGGSLHVDFVVSLAAAGLAGAVLAVVIGLPALRIRGLFLAVTSLAFAATTGSYLLNPTYFHAVLPDTASAIARPVLYRRFDVTSSLAYYYVCLAGLGLAVAVARCVRTSRSGRLFIGTRDNPRAAQSYGVPLARTRLAAFAISGFLAALAGALFVFLQGALDPGVFTPTASIEIFAMAVIGGLSSITGALLGAAYVVTFRYLAPQFSLLATGAGMLLLLMFFPGGLAELVFRVRDMIVESLMNRPPRAEPPIVEAAGVHATPAPQNPDAQQAGTGGSRGDVLLSCEDVHVAYGDVQVLCGVNLTLWRGEILALLGTNGAGKSTLLRAVCGLVHPHRGAIKIGGDDVTSQSPAAIARAGVAEVPGGKGVFPTLTVAENLAVASWRFRRDRERRESGVEDVLRRFPRLRERLRNQAGDLSGGEQQMLALGMALLSRPTLLIIDELSLGLAPVIVAQLLDTVREINAQGTTVLLVEQSLNVALTVADRAYFLEKGEVRFEGRTAELLDRDDVARSVFLQNAGAGAGAGAGATLRDAASEEREKRVVFEARRLTVRFGGIHAVNAVDLPVHAGDVIGVIGPNGAGKTTLFDLLSGFLTPDSGEVWLQGRNVTTWSPDRRAWAGLGRSFQDARIFSSLTVAENLAVAFERHLAVRDHFAAMLGLPEVREAEVDLAWSVNDLTELMGLGPYRDKRVGELSTGTRRMVDLAMVVAHQPSVLLLDEPSSGIAQREVEALVPVIGRIRDETGCAIVLIEHDMPLVTAVSDELVALELGAVIARGSVDAVVSDPRVVAAYLGTDEATIHRSGTGADGSRSQISAAGQ